MARPHLRFRKMSVLAAVAVVLAACAPGVGDLPSSPQGPAPNDVRLAQQRDAVAAAMKRLEEQSAAVYDSLTRVWKAGHDGTRPLTSAGSVGVSFVPCQPVPYDGQLQLVGPLGGDLKFGPHRLQIPPGALTDYKWVGVSVVSDLKAEVVLLPHGTQFAVPVKLTVSYADCDPAAGHRLAYIDDDDTILEWPSSSDQTGSMTVVASLSHFSKYAVAY